MTTRTMSPRRRAGYRGLLLLCVALACGFVALAVWQVERRAWKHALIARVESRVHEAPIDAPDRARWPQVDAVDDEYRPVRLQGAWLRDHDTFVRAVTVFGSGYWTITPLRRGDGSVVLVNRGFVDGDRRASLPRVDDGPVTVTGLLRLSEPHGSFLGHNDPAADRWVSRDVAAIAARRGIADVAPFFVDAAAATEVASDGGDTVAARAVPVGGLTVVAFADHHGLYAVVWALLAALCAGAAVYLVRGIGR